MGSEMCIRDRFIGLEFSGSNKKPDAALATWIINAMKDEGILIGAAGAFGNVLKIRPALCFTQDNADQLIDTLARLLARI